MSKSTPEPLAPIVLSENCILDGVFYKAGDALPCSSADLPETLAPFLVVAGDEPEEADEAEQANFEPNVVYAASEDGRSGRRLRRDVVRLEAENARQDWAEEQFETPIRADLAAALQEANDEHVARQIAELEIHARWHDQAADEAAQGGNEL